MKMSEKAFMFDSETISYYPSFKEVDHQQKVSLLSEWIKNNTSRYAQMRARDLAFRLRKLTQAFTNKLLESDEDHIALRDLVVKAANEELNIWKDEWKQQPDISEFEVIITGDGFSFSFEFNEPLLRIFDGAEISYDACTKYPFAQSEFKKWVELKIEADS